MLDPRREKHPRHSGNPDISTWSDSEVEAEFLDVANVRVRYLDFQRTYSRARPTMPAAIFGAWIRLITAWRQFPTLDPELPDSLLAAKWPRQSAYEVFQRRSAEWAEPALEYFRSLDAS